jgi:circadian clock protein KaiB
VADQLAGDRWALTLYIDGASPRSIQAIETVRYVCDEEFPGLTDLEVVDVRQQPGLAARDHILAVPALLKRSPGPPCCIVDGLCDSGRLRDRLALLCAPSVPRLGADE